MTFRPLSDILLSRGPVQYSGDDCESDCANGEDMKSVFSSILTIWSLLLLLCVAALSATTREDADGDGIDDAVDNCPYAYNPDQADSNSNGIGDQCDVLCGDINGDGTAKDIADFVYLLDWLFSGGAEPPNLQAANCGGCGGVNVYDAVRMFCWMWSECPEGQCYHQIACDPGVEGCSIRLGSVEGLMRPDTLHTGEPVVFQMRLANASGRYISGLTNAMRVYSSDGVEWNQTSMSGTTELFQLFDWGGIREFGVTGSMADTVAVWCVDGSHNGLPIGFDATPLSISIGPIDHAYSGGHICIDSCWFPPSNPWLWASNQMLTKIVPTWDGPHCFTIFNCCQIRGDVNRSGANPDIADLVYFVSYMFQAGPPPPCMNSADINGDDGDVPDISDLVCLVTYMFQSGPAPAPCPE
jgi:hypothetical protein